MPGVQIGLNSLYYAILTKDDATGVTYSAPVKIAGAINAKITPKSNTDILYTDDGPDEVLYSMGEIDVELNTKDLDLDTQAALLGHTVTGGVLVRKETDIPPYLAIGFKSKKSNGKYRYMWLFKGQFSLPDQDYATKEDKPKAQTPKIKGTFIRRAYDAAWQKVTDEDHVNYVSSIGTNWFTSVESTADTVPPTVTTTPIDEATAVAVTAAFVWTFSEAIQASLVTPANFFVVKNSDGTVVAGTLAVSGGNTIVTFTPSANLTALTDYIAIATTNVKDLAGNALAANSVTNFKTA